MLGSLGKEKLKADGFDLDENFSMEIAPPTYVRSMDISDLVYEMYTNGEADEVFLIYTQMHSAVNMEAQSIRILPAEVHTLEKVYVNNNTIFNLFKERTEEDKALIHFVPDITEVYKYLVNTYLNGVIYGALTEAFASEQTARMTSMDNATKSANDMIKDLTILGNQARQAKVTNELAEIVGGASALSQQEEHNGQQN